jgi:NADH-quinone oxidoreductase subunit L
MIAHVGTPGMVEAGWLIPAMPLAGSLILLAFGKRIGKAAGPLATVMMTLSAIFSFIVLGELLQRNPEGRSFVETLWTWFSTDSFTVDFALRIDQLTAVMLCVVTGVGTLIHLYSVGYMRGDEREPRFFAYLNLFAAAMLVLVMADDLLVMFLGWEGVGVCSYLLIGFWFTDRANASAAKKAFIVNRVGDAAFLVAIFLLVTTIGSLRFEAIAESAPALLSSGTALAIGLLLLAGAAGKSAQIPLHVWLPDAMAGPTPVSALIHAATMVTAGIYLLVRMLPVFEVAPAIGLETVAWVGTATMLIGGFMAIAQDDIKKILAYSTISQLGYMVMGIGVGAATASVFHLVTHAFFKALLFLGAGSVMHALAGKTDITKMGGLFRAIPWTAVTFIAGWLAIIGFPFTAGFFSKDQILEGAYVNGDTAIWVIGLIGAVITGFYMTRLVTLTFFGKSRDPEAHPHESPSSMVFPLFLLAVASIIGGLVLNTHPETGNLASWLEPVIHPAHHESSGFSALQLSLFATGAGLAGASLAAWMYTGNRFDWKSRRENPNALWRAARHRFYIDQVYEFVFTGVGKVGASALAYVVDARIVDGAVVGTGTLTQRVADEARRVQNGFARTYALAILIGTLAIGGYLIGRNW